jgi:hypothetical protein
MKPKNSIFGLIMILISCSFFTIPSSALNNPDYIEVITPGDAIFFSFNLSQNDVLKIEFEVTDGGNKDVDFYILDSVNFNKWNNSESFSYLLFRSRAVYVNINFLVPDNDTLFIIFSNSFSIITSKTVEIDFTLNPESNNEGTFPLEALLGIMIAVAIIIVSTFVIIVYKRRPTKKKKIYE